MGRGCVGNKCGFWRELQNSTAASVMYLVHLAFHPNKWVHQTTSRLIKPFLNCSPIVQSYLTGDAS